MRNSQSKKKKDLQAQADVVLKLLTNRGMLPDSKITNDSRRAANQKRRKDRYHNTQLLLKNYRLIAWLVECFPETVAEELERPFQAVDELLDGMEVASTFGERKLANRVACIERTRLMLDRVNEALTVLMKRPENGQMLYNLVRLTYIVPEKLSVTEILYQLNISVRQYYRLREQAIDILSARLWGSPDPMIDFWLELISLNES